LLGRETAGGAQKTRGHAQGSIGAGYACGTELDPVEVSQRATL